MKRPLQIILAVVTIVFAVLTLRARQHARADAELWAQATDEF